MKPYALDTNVIIDYFKNKKRVVENFDVAHADGYKLIISQPVHYEMARGFLCYPAPKKEQAYKFMLSSSICEFIKMDAKTWKRAEQVYLQLYEKRITVGDMDILIAAQCLAHNYTLVTANTKHFEIIDGLAVVDWTV